MESVVHQSSFSFLKGGGKIGEKVRQFPWEATSIGSPALWPLSLQTTVSILLNTDVPMFLLCGEHFTCIYNHAFQAILSQQEKEIDAIGKPGSVLWQDDWGTIQLWVRDAMQRSESTRKEEVFLKNASQGEAYFWTFNIVPIHDDAGKAIGAFVTCNVKAAQTNKNAKGEKLHIDFYKIVHRAPIAIAVFRGNDFTAEIANDTFLQLVGKTEQDFIGKPIFTSLPVLQNVLQPHIQNLIEKGLAFTVKEIELIADRDDHVQKGYFNFVAEPLQNVVGIIGSFMVIGTDVTEQTIARKQVEESEQRFQNLVRDASVGIIVLLGTEMKVIVVNEAYGRLIGRSVEEILDQPLFSIIPEAEKPFRELLDTVRLTGEPLYLYDHPYQVYAGEKTIEGFLNIVYQPYKESDGTITGVMVLCQDVTEQVTARKETNEAEERMRIAINAAELGTVEVDLLTDETISSPRFDQIFDVSNSNERKRYIDAFHPDDLIIRTKAYERAFKDGILEYEARIIRKDRSVAWLRAKGRFFFDENKKPVRLFGVIQDITEEKKFADELARQVKERTAEVEMSRREIERSANRLRSVFNTTPSGMFIFSPVKNDKGEVIDFRFVITNPSFAAYVGQTPEVLDGELGSKWFPGYLHNGVFDMYKKTYLTGETLRQDVHYNVDGLDIYLDLMSSKVGHEVLVTFSDYTPLKVAQLQLEKYIEDLKRSNANLEEFAYAASHDLKEPVRKVHVFSDRLKNSLQGRMNTEEEHFFERMQMAAKRMNLLIDDLLNYSQVSIRPDFTDEVDLNQLLAVVLSDLDLEIEQKKATIKMDKLPTIRGHHRQLQQAFQNLLSNSLKYSKQQAAPLITITCNEISGSQLSLPLSPAEMQKHFYAITLKDNGIGFDQSDAEKVFNVFTRLHGNAEYRGTGVGLSIVRKVMGNHQGYIYAESVLGKGASFYLFFPKDLMDRAQPH
ncbi:MAG TPA: PAS domain-containing protein [Flavisolibacter sp.]